MSQIFILDLGSRRTTQVQRCARLGLLPMLITPSLSNYHSISDDNDDSRNKHWFSKTSTTAECLMADLLASLTHCKDGKCYKSVYPKIKIYVLKKARTSSILWSLIYRCFVSHGVCVTFPVQADCNISFFKSIFMYTYKNITHRDLQHIFPRLKKIHLVTFSLFLWQNFAHSMGNQCQILGRKNNT